jgi:hypothetical protein
MAVGVGVLLGVALQLSLGWPWWVVAAILVAAVWLAFLATALAGPARGRGLITEVLIEVSPERGMARRKRQLEAIFRSPPFPLYGLGSSWEGPRFLGGYGTSSGMGVHTLELGHGEPLSERGPEVRVEASIGDPDLPPQRAEGTRIVSIPVDGAPAEFTAVFDGPRWEAVGRVGGTRVTIRGREVPLDQVELVTVRDALIEPYIEGHRRMMEKAFRRPEPSP